MEQNEKRSRIEEAVNDPGLQKAAALIVEVVLDDTEDVADIAADFVENEIGRFDWVNNWSVVRGKRDVVAMVQQYLTKYGLTADPVAVVAQIDQMASENPGRWK